MPTTTPAPLAHPQRRLRLRRHGNRPFQKEFCRSSAATTPFAPPAPHIPSTPTTACRVAYYGFRYYSPDTGRWPSRDPIGEAGGINLYGFVSNDGVNGTDLLGLVNILAPGNEGGFFRRQRESDYLNDPGDLIFGEGKYENVGSRRSRAGVYCTAGLAASRDASKRGKEIGNRMCESSDTEHNILSHSAGVQNAVEGILHFAARYCSPCCGCAVEGSITINLMGMAPKRNPKKIRDTLEKAQKMCPELEDKLKLNIWITYDREDSKIWRTGGGFLHGAWKPDTLCKSSPFNSCKETTINQLESAEFGVHGFTSHVGQDLQENGNETQRRLQQAAVKNFFNQS